MASAEDELLIEQVVGAHRARDLDGRVKSHPAWHDLDAAGRVEAFDAQELSRKLEAAMDGAGQSTTVKAVLARIRRG
jgi:hypothetical protein